MISPSIIYYSDKYIVIFYEIKYYVAIQDNVFEKNLVTGKMLSII